MRQLPQDLEEVLLPPRLHLLVHHHRDHRHLEVKAGAEAEVTVRVKMKGAVARGEGEVLQRLVGVMEERGEELTVMMIDDDHQEQEREKGREVEVEVEVEIARIILEKGREELVMIDCVTTTILVLLYNK